jgi:hypothetical protein
MRCRFFWLFVSLASLAGSGCNNQSVERRVFANKTFLRVDGDARIDPQAIVRDDRDGYILVGSAGTSAWAANLGPRGNIRWSHLTPLLEAGTIEAVYHSAVSLPDGTFWVCGAMSRPPRSNEPRAMLTRLGADGRLLSQQLIRATPDEDTVTSLESFLACARWGDAVVTVGPVIRFSAQGGTPGGRKFYWIRLMTPAGDLLWEKYIPVVAQNAVVNPNGWVVVAAESGLLISATDSMTTEVLRVGTEGDLQARAQVSGRFLLIQPADGATASNSTVRLFGWSHSGAPSAVVVLDDMLRESRRTEGDLGPLFANVAYGLPDGSLALFGFNSVERATRYVSHAVHADSSMKPLLSVDAATQPPLTDIGQIRAAAPAHAPGEFVVVRPVFPLQPSAIDSSRAPREFERGAVTEFLRF